MCIVSVAYRSEGRAETTGGYRKHLSTVVRTDTTSCSININNRVVPKVMQRFGEDQGSCFFLELWSRQDLARLSIHSSCIFCFTAKGSFVYTLRTAVAAYRVPGMTPLTISGIARYCQCGYRCINKCLRRESGTSYCTVCSKTESSSRWFISSFTSHL